MARLVRPIDSRGAVLGVTVGQVGSRSQARRKWDLPWIEPITFAALIDTGAGASAIEPSIVEALQLPPAGVTGIYTPTSGGMVEDRALHEIRFAIAGDEPKVIFQSLVVVGCDPLAANGYLMLIGRDILDRCEFTYDGPKGEFTLDY